MAIHLKGTAFFDVQKNDIWCTSTSITDTTSLLDMINDGHYFKCTIFETKD